MQNNKKKLPLCQRIFLIQSKDLWSFSSTMEHTITLVQKTHKCCPSNSKLFSCSSSWFAPENYILTMLFLCQYRIPPYFQSCFLKHYLLRQSLISSRTFWVMWQNILEVVDSIIYLLNKIFREICFIVNFIVTASFLCHSFCFKIFCIILYTFSFGVFIYRRFSDILWTTFITFSTFLFDKKAFKGFNRLFTTFEVCRKIFFLFYII